MISYLFGKPVIEKDFVTILCGGVGYAVHVTDKVKVELTAQVETELFIYTHVREESLDLYGFARRNERELFTLLLSVSGVGPKTALLILNFPPEQIIDAIQQANTSLFSSVPRVGKKVAQKIIIDLRGKLGSIKELDIGPVSQQRQEVALALQVLGFAETEIHQALQNINVEELSVAEAVKLGIKELSKK
jgi:Holliday junction DNA helicase RuvA